MDDQPLQVVVQDSSALTALSVNHNDDAYHMVVYIPKLSFVGDLSSCMLVENMYEQEGTMHTYFQQIVAYVRQHYPDRTYMIVNDMCARLYNDDMRLAHLLMPYLTTGQFWYQLAFGGYRTAEAEARFQKYERSFQEKKRILPWAVFENFIPGDLPFSASEMRALYNAASSWQAFFAPLCVQLGEEAFCHFLAPWIRRFISIFFNHLFGATEFLIPLSD
jgi:hypothetical protein